MERRMGEDADYGQMQKENKGKELARANESKGCRKQEVGRGGSILALVHSEFSTYIS